MAEMIWEIGVNQSEAKKAGKTIAKESSKTGGAAFGGGLIGGLLGGLLSSVKGLFEPLSAIASLLITALFPILKPFLILFLKVGLLLYKFLNKALGTTGDVSGISGKDDEGKTVVGEQGKKIALWAGIILGGIAAIAAFIVGIPATLAVAIGLAVVVFGKKFIEAFIWFHTKLKEISDFMGELFINNIKLMGEKIMLFVGLLGDLLGKVLVWVGDTWKDFVESLSKAWDSLKTLGSWMWDTLTGVFSTAWEALKGIGSWIKGKIKSLLSFGRGDSGSVNDAIITPNGDIIRTNPADYLIATKNPSALMGGNGGGSNITVTINGGLITDDVARDIGQVILREVNSGGGF